MFAWISWGNDDIWQPSFLQKFKLVEVLHLNIFVLNYRFLPPKDLYWHLGSFFPLSPTPPKSILLRSDWYVKTSYLVHTKLMTVGTSVL